MKRLIAEFEPQSFIQMIFPHKETDWAPYLEEVRQTYQKIIKIICRYEQVVLICSDKEEVRSYFPNQPNLTCIEYVSDDTWARDCSALSVCVDGEVVLYDFEFTAWGGKFGARRDNALTQALKHHYPNRVEQIDFILEGGGIESNGDGVLITTATCMLNPNRNPLSKEEISHKLTTFFGLRDVEYLEHGYLAGDDTDSHIDTLARFIDTDHIVYIQCQESTDEHYEELLLMEQELKKIAKKHNFRLTPLPFCDAVFYEGERLPATYANFLILNGAVIVPTYGVRQDSEALEIFQKLFPNRDVVGVDCRVLIRQHGSLHCATMQFGR